MSAVAQLTRMKKWVRKTLLLEVLRLFPVLTEEELRKAINLKREFQKNGPAHMRWFTETYGPLSKEKPEREEVEEGNSLGLIKLTSETCAQRPRLHGSEGPIVTEAKALKMIEDRAPDIPVNELASNIYIVVECNRRTHQEIDFVARHGYWPEFESGKTEGDIKHFREHGCWPGEEDEDGKS